MGSQEIWEFLQECPTRLTGLKFSQIVELFFQRDWFFQSGFYIFHFYLKVSRWCSKDWATVDSCKEVTNGCLTMPNLFPLTPSTLRNCLYPPRGIYFEDLVVASSSLGSGPAIASRTYTQSETVLHIGLQIHIISGITLMIELDYYQMFQCYLPNCVLAGRNGNDTSSANKSDCWP